MGMYRNHLDTRYLKVRLIRPQDIVRTVHEWAVTRNPITGCQCGWYLFYGTCGHLYSRIQNCCGIVEKDGLEDVGQFGWCSAQDKLQEGMCPL